jgi:hypothetical protein
VKKRELILGPGTTFFKAFWNDYFAFFQLNSWKERWKKGGKSWEELKKNKEASI